MKLPKRLDEIQKLIEDNVIVIDVGCDHALLDIYLTLNRDNVKCIACDINENALNGGILNIKKHHLEAKIKTKLGSGIEVITNDINTLIISGMGTNTICNILTSPKLKQINKIIVESNNDYYELRKFITSIGFYISYEEVIYDNNKYYINIVFLRGFKKYSKKELIYGPILMKGNFDYYKYLYDKNISILNNIPKNKIITRFNIIKENLFLKKLIKK